ncbi:MAG: hypothetical protein K2N16_04725, partial [Muribaculaceae bacterium]|nr:hypothetical protein [Muribaculaceae bacterium]
MKKDGKSTLKIAAVAMLALAACGCLAPMLADTARQTPQIRPQIPTADRDAKNRVFLERADVLHKQSTDSFLVLTGDVQFSKGGMMMYCDSAHYYPETESLDAFGHVRMEQGDTLFVYGDSLIYDGPRELAKLYGLPARLIDRDASTGNEVKLESDTVFYDMVSDIGYYETGGTLVDDKNKLKSIYGEYVPSENEAHFSDYVELRSVTEANDTILIFAQSLVYNTATHDAVLDSRSEIINKADTIFTSNGIYNTDTEVARLFDRSLVRMGRGTTLTGDTLFYDKTAGYGWARGNMELIDSARQSSLSGDYGYYDQNIDSCYVTGRALCKEYSQGDTLYMHGREIYSFASFDTIQHEADTLAGIPAYCEADTNHVIICHPRVRFYRSDMQGVCDSLRFEERDSMLYMLRHPIVWSDERQIFGNVIQLHMGDSTIDYAMLPKFAFTAQQVEGNYFDQLSGKEMVAYFTDGQLSHLDVSGNVEAIMLPMENDSTYNKIINVASSFLSADFVDQKIDRIKMWPETSGTVTPLYLAKKSLFRLAKFRWFT